MNEQTGRKVPQIRFKGFDGDWVEKKLGEIMAVGSVKRIHQSDWTKAGVRFLRARDIVSAYKNEDPADVLYISQSKYDEYSVLSGKVEIGDLLVTGVGTIGIPYLIRKSDPIYFKDGNIIWFKNHGTLNGDFLYYSFIGERIQNYIKESAGTGTVGTYTIGSGKDTPLASPIFEEQQKIGTYFRTLDELIGLHQRKHDKLVTLKKTMLQKMFPQPGGATPEVRFKGFSGDWEEKKLGDVFRYERPDQYIVESSEYSNEHRTPVLTANKAFILGYTNETRTFNKPCIIFDDFTLEAKFVDFQFMVKSSAIKLLTIQDSEVDDLYFAFLTLSNAQIEMMGHARHYIGVVQPTVVRMPKITEQQKIGTYFRTLDELISQHASQLQKLQQIKSACLEKMFV